MGHKQQGETMKMLGRKAIAFDSMDSLNDYLETRVPILWQKTNNYHGATITELSFNGTQATLVTHGVGCPILILDT